MPSLREANRRFNSMNGSGCIFEHYGKIPEEIYKMECYRSPLEDAVSKNDVTTFKQLVQDGEVVSIGLKIGGMTCVEYCAMMGQEEMLRLLIQNSVHASILSQYYALGDHVERAYMISRNKNIFFDKEGLVEVNRYEAALYTAVEYNQPGCTRLMLSVLGPRDPGKHNFITSNNTQQKLSACELAQIRGHTECYEILQRQAENNAAKQKS